MVKDNKSIGERIRHFRMEKGYSQEFVANKLHLTQQAYAVIEKNPERASFSRLKEISEILTVDIGVLLGILENDTLTKTNFIQNDNVQPSISLNTQLTLNISCINSFEDLEQLIQLTKQLVSKNQSLRDVLE
jgi:transcriptional regulator with XRE-family HTH domain